MKKFLLLCLLVVLACCVFVGCNNSTSESNIEYVDSWVSNTYTDFIPKPSAGDVYYIIDETEDGSFTIALNNLTSSDCSAYISSLAIYGFMTDTNIENNVSSSAYLTKDDVSVSVAYESGVMEITISSPKQSTIG
ncbi:MAG: hypothetical protein R3Y23_05150 [Bacillota bacterium]